MAKSLQIRIERLESRTFVEAERQWHRLIQQIGETEDAAKARYVLESGNRIEPGSNLVIRVLTEPLVCVGRPA